MWFPHHRPRLSAQLLLEGRHRLSEYLLVFTGHNFWRYHNNLVEKELARRGRIPWSEVTPPYCNYCLKVMPTTNSAEYDDFYQTTWHFFSSCEVFAALRLEMFGEAYYKPLNEIDRKSVLEFLRRANIDIFPKDNSEVMNIDIDLSDPRDEED
jgi:hypothetical protein